MPPGVSQISSERPLTGHPGAAPGDFYHLRGVSLAGRCCQGLACFAARRDAPDRWQVAHAGPRVYCLGKCYRAPAEADHDARPAILSVARKPVLLGNVLAGGARELGHYLARGGGRALVHARAQAAGDIIRAIEISGLRGRGGAGFPTGRKWALVAAEAARPKYLVANADEGDPGAFSDRFLMEDDPFRLLEGMCIAAHAVGAARGYIYLRREYPHAAEVLARALDEARAAGWFTGGFDIELVVGQGSYVSGEETSMLNAIEGKRPEVRLRPPQITRQGLFGQPTLVNNVETLCAVPWIIEQGGAAYAQLGFSNSRGTKLLSLNSLFNRPGLYEVEFGIRLREIVDGLGGGLRRGALKALMIGGPLAGLLPPRLLDTRLGFEEMHAVGAAVGHGGVIAFTDDTPLASIVEQVFRFGAYESCGKCVPCHRGTPAIEHMFAAGAACERSRYAAIIHALAQTSLCAHGRGLAEFARSLELHFAGELAACFA
jgi:formate dehydrogenase iron-sulfur subunit